jgi:hypothetical protein
MVDPISHSAKKRVHSYRSFWWTAAKMAKKRAWAQLGNLLVIVSLIQFGLLAECVSKITKGVDVNFWLTFSPVIISVFGFLTFLFRAAHKIYERELNSEQSNSEDAPENEPPKPAMLVIFIAVILVCVGLVIYIICSCGNLRFSPTGNILNIYTHIPDGNSYAMIKKDDRDIIDQKLRLLVGAQFDFLNNTNN